MLNNIRPLEPGSMVKFTVFGERRGMKQSFKLALISFPDLLRKQRATGLAFISKEAGQTVYCSGPYSGGTTGGGVHSWSVRPLERDMEVLTTKLHEIYRVCGWKD